MSYDLSEMWPHIGWRNRAGEIECTGDECPKKCDRNCPVWCNTKGLEALSQERLDVAEKAFSRAISIASDFADAHNNLGSVYGMTGKDQWAYEEFSTALSLKPDYIQALRGLIIAEKNLGKYDEALRHCDDIDSLQPGSSTALRKEIMKLKSPAKDISWGVIATQLLEEGRESGYIKSEGVPFIPELLMMAEDTNFSLYRGMVEYKQTHSQIEVMVLTYTWAAYAGIGAVYHWHTNWEELQHSRLFDVLTKERGLSEMDEYVLDRIGLPINSEDGHELYMFLARLGFRCKLLVAESGKKGYNAIMDGAKAMFAFGVVFEMNRLGMM